LPCSGSTVINPAHRRFHTSFSFFCILVECALRKKGKRLRRNVSSGDIIALTNEEQIPPRPPQLIPVLFGDEKDVGKRITFFSIAGANALSLFAKTKKGERGVESPVCRVDYRRTRTRQSVSVGNPRLNKKYLYFELPNFEVRR